MHFKIAFFSYINVTSICMDFWWHVLLNVILNMFFFCVFFMSDPEYAAFLIKITDPKMPQTKTIVFIEIYYDKLLIFTI